MTTLTISVENKTKEIAQKISKKEGVTLTFLINQFLKAYAQGNFSFALLSKDDKDFIDLSRQLTNLAENKIDVNKLESLADQLK